MGGTRLLDLFKPKPMLLKGKHKIVREGQEIIVTTSRDAGLLRDADEIKKMERIVKERYRKANPEKIAEWRRKGYAKLTPEQKARRHALARARYAERRKDIAFVLEKRRIAREWRRKMSLNPEWLAKENARRKADRASMTPEEKAEMLAIHREWAKFKLRNDPVWAEKERARKRAAYHRRMEAKRAQTLTGPGEARQDIGGDKAAHRVDGRSKARKAAGPTDTGGEKAGATRTVRKMAGEKGKE